MVTFGRDAPAVKALGGASFAPPGKLVTLIWSPVPLRTPRMQPDQTKYTLKLANSRTRHPREARLTCRICQNFSEASRPGSTVTLPFMPPALHTGRQNVFPLGYRNLRRTQRGSRSRPGGGWLRPC